MCHELLANIKFLKFYAWEEMFSKKVLEARNDELRSTTHLVYI
jgi:hypothetical protein